MRDRSRKVKFHTPGSGRKVATLEAYASDASIYRVIPEEVIIPADEAELASVVNRALAAGRPITARGAGTGLSGGALGRGLVIDCSRLTRILGIFPAARIVTCQPGIIHRDLNLVLKEHGLFFPPDPSSGDSCQIGGMLANNSSGPKSVKYGLTSHYVEAVTIIGQKGMPLELRKLSLSAPETETFFGLHPEYREILTLLSENRRLILERWPRVKKNSSGYNLAQVIADLDSGWYNLPALYVGSEGTFGIFTATALRLLPLPQGSCSFRLFFGSLEAAGDAVAPLLDTAPSSLEIVDGSTLTLLGREKFGTPATAEAMLLLEYDDELEYRESLLTAVVPHLKLSHPVERAVDEKQSQALWAARKAITATLYRLDPIKRPVPFIEDASLPVERLPEFIGWVRRRLESDHLTFGLFGHIGDGNLHIRPLLNLNNASDFSLMKRLYDEVYEKIFELGGSSTAEHADGRLRGPLVRRLYGDDLYRLFGQIKTILDPRGLFNPDVVLTDKPFTENIDLAKLELTCAACGKCNGYCPAYEIFRREDMSPRGWLRIMKIGAPAREAVASFYSFCLNCKNCTTVCPAGVDIAGEILDFKAGRPGKIAGSVISLFNRPRLFSQLLSWGAIAAPLTESKPVRAIAGLIGRGSLGWDSDVVLPRPARPDLRKRHQHLCRSEGEIAYFHGCADNYFESGAGDALITVFRHYGYEVTLPPQDCCGLPMEVYGHRDELIRRAKGNLDNLATFRAVVFTCASCLHRLADYEHLFEPGTEYHDKAKALKLKLYDACQFLLAQDITLPSPKSDAMLKISYHHPCHLRAAGLEQHPLKLLDRIPNVRILHPDLAGRCCGQAGSFGYVHHQEGKAIFAAKKEEYQRLGADVIVSSCPSCISKIRAEMGDGVQVCHPLEIIAEMVSGERADERK